MEAIARFGGRSCRKKVNESILNDEIKEHLKENRIDHMTYLEGMEVLDSDIDKRVIEAAKAYDSDKYTAKDVRRALLHTNKTPEDFGALFITGSDAIFGRDRPAGTAGDEKTFW